MDGIQITKNLSLEAISKKETFDKVDSVKIKIKKALLTPEDFVTFEGDPTVNYPIIPARSAIALVSELGRAGGPFLRGERIYPHPEIACGKCYECNNGKEAHCSDFIVAGKTTDGFLRNFAVFNTDDLAVLPTAVKDDDALFLDHVALCVNVVNAINLKKGEHVIIVGGDALGIILAQLVMYYQGVPILVDNNDENIIIAQNAGVYYTLFADNKIEKNVSDLTGARLSTKVVYMTGSNLNTDIALKLAGYNATVCFAGFSTPSLRVNFTSALVKSLEFKCVTNGYGSIESAINLLAVKSAVNLGVFNVQSVKQEQAMATIKEISKSNKKAACSKMLIVEMS
ncbi:MAG: alcohol dehydrogenase catalytic domain-containing protein [Clostridia bacterium]|nr:alcohol dehydrogenase catalytic domain-containing protein [Clostridia bacterium]